MLPVELHSMIQTKEKKKKIRLTAPAACITYHIAVNPACLHMQSSQNTIVRIREDQSKMQTLDRNHQWQRDSTSFAHPADGRSEAVVQPRLSIITWVMPSVGCSRIAHIQPIGPDPQ